jgi:hypothetical protein
MRNKPHLYIFFAVLMSLCQVVIADDMQSPALADIDPIVTVALPAHPRLMLTPQVNERVTRFIATDPWAQRFFGRIQKGAQQLLQQPVIERNLIGNKRKRLLFTSRSMLSNVITLGMVYKFKPTEALKNRLVSEMISVADFQDWHPSHFLDTAEMTLAMALGYDWLYNDLTPEQRKIIRDAIIKHGLQTALKYTDGMNVTYNWNQIRHATLTAGALAVYEDAPQLAEQILHQAKEHFRIALHAYEGQGVYPEGPIYWEYGTSFSCVMAANLQTTLGNDWGILQSKGFAQSFDYIQQVILPTGKMFNYGDSRESPIVLPMHMWIGQQLERHDLMQLSAQNLESYIQGGNKIDYYRLAPLALLWYEPVDSSQIKQPTLFYIGRGQAVQLAMIRSAWDQLDASFIGIKAGKIRVNHGHMDIGAFIIEADGKRWASDLGPEKEIYDRKDSWATDQPSRRWTYFRANNFSHNTLTLGGHLQQVDGENPIISAKQTQMMSFAVVDMTDAYHGQAASVHRGIALFKDRSMLIRDEYTGMAADLDLRWNMVTQAQVRLEDAHHATLSLEGVTMHVAIHGPVEAHLSVCDAKPMTQVENSNHDFKRLVINIPMPVSDGSLTVSFVPGSVTDAQKPELGMMSTWDE